MTLSLEQSGVAGGGADLQLVEELDHEAAEALDGARGADLRVDLGQHVLRGMDVDLRRPALLIGESSSASSTWCVMSGWQLGDVLPDLADDVLAVVAVQQLVFLAAQRVRRSDDRSGPRPIQLAAALLRAAGGASLRSSGVGQHA